MHATDFLDGRTEKVGPVIVVFGKERFLKFESTRKAVAAVLGAESDGLGLVRLPGATDLKSVMDALLTVSMWNPTQLVLVEDADDFVSEHREKLEKYLERPAKKSVLMLDLKSFPSNTRLAKKAAAVGLVIDCSELKGAAAVVSWILKACPTRHGKKIGRQAAQLVVDLAGQELGIIDQELAKLAAYAGQAPTIEAEAVEKLVGGWRMETTWKMLDAVRDDRLPVALECLEKLVASGEPPLKLLGGINYVFRPLARATELSRQGQNLEEVLIAAGVKSFNVRSVVDYLKRLKRPRAERILGWLLDADLGLKGASNLPERVVLERLLLRLAGKA